VEFGHFIVGSDYCNCGVGLVECIFIY
jgi:hypothetical protein